jgi:hypothetical protein
MGFSTPKCAGFQRMRPCGHRALKSSCLDVPLKMDRLRQWCEDINKAQAVVKYDFVYIDEESFNKYKPTSFKDLAGSFNEYKK